LKQSKNTELRELLEFDPVSLLNVNMMVIGSNKCMWMGC